ncbi:MAG TPA: hypothetical protein VH189_12245 [Rhizomicrobium sp.]|nr:hypothetical protein [Rhizomicrobium sp.]
MHAFGGTIILLTTVFLTVETAMAAEVSPPLRLRFPFENLLTEDGSTTASVSPHRHCAISGEQAMRIERDTSDPCLAADAAPGGACFGRLGLGKLQSERSLLPRDGRHCAE